MCVKARWLSTRVILQCKGTHSSDNWLPGDREGYLIGCLANRKSKNHTIVCSWVQLHLLANSSLFTTELLVSRDRLVRIMPRTSSIFSAHSFSDVHRPIPLLAQKSAKAQKNTKLQRYNSLFYFSV